MGDCSARSNIFGDAIPALFPFQIKDPFTGKDDERVGEAGLKDIYPNH